MTTSELENLKARLDQVEMLDHESAHALLRDSIIYARKVFGDQSAHVSALGNVQFRHPTMIFDSNHHMNSDIWNQGARDLRSAFDAMTYETGLIETPNTTSPTTEKITLDWLIKHVPVNFWISAIAMLAAVFSIGYVAGSSSLVKRLISVFESSQ